MSWEQSGQEPFDVAVVGAGFTGSALAVRLLQTLPPGSRIALIGMPPSFGRGLAFGTDDPAHSLNVVAGKMSMFPDRPADFVEFLQERDDVPGGSDGEALPDRFVPRYLYGAYVQDRLAAAREQATGTVVLETFAVPAHDLRPNGAGWEISIEGDLTIQAGHVALCLGNSAAGSVPAPGANDPAVAAKTIVDPWRDPRLGDITSDDTVLIVGSGLTALDVLMSRVRLGHAGKTLLVSRRGLLPAPHRHPSPAPAPIEGIDAVSDLSELVRVVKARVRQVEADGGDWRSVIDGLRPVTQKLWMNLSSRDRRSFLRHANAYWGVWRHRMPMHVARQVELMRASGQLQVLAARIVKLAPTADGQILATLLPRRTASQREERVDWIVNCSGLERGPAETGNPLPRSMLAHGFARPDELNLGLDVSDRSAVIAANGEPWSTLFALGPITLGTFWEIVAAPDLRVQCARVADEIATDVRAAQHRGQPVASERA